MESTDFRLIPLSGSLGRGKHTLVDADDYEWLSHWSWNLSRRGYASATITVSRGVKKKLCMHRLIMGTPMRGWETDHINRDRLDNRRANLRIVTGYENRMNRTDCIQRNGSPKPMLRVWVNRASKYGGWRAVMPCPATRFKSAHYSATVATRREAEADAVELVRRIATHGCEGHAKRDYPLLSFAPEN